MLFHLPVLRSLWKGVCHPLHRSTSSRFKSLSCSCQRSSGVKKMVYWESIGLSGIRRDPPYAYYLLAACSLPLMVDYVRVSWYSLSRAFHNAGSSFQSQSIPAFRSSAGAGVHLDCTGSSVLLAFCRSHTHRLHKCSFQPQSSVLPVTLLIWLLSTCAVSHVSFFSFVWSLESCCLLCNCVCSLENLAQIDKSQFAPKMWQGLSFFSSVLCSPAHRP